MALTIVVTLAEQAPTDAVAIILAKLNLYGRVIPAGSRIYRCTITHEGKMQRIRNRMTYWENQGVLQWWEVGG